MDQIEHVLQKYPNHFVVSESISARIDTKYVDRRIKCFEDRRVHEAKLFWYSPTEPNCLAFFYFKADKYDEALVLNKEVGHRWPENIIAKTDRLGMLKEMEDLPESKQIIKSIKSINDSFKKELAIAEAEMAYFIEDMGPLVYPEAKRRYETALSLYIKEVAGTMNLYKLLTEGEYEEYRHISRRELTCWFLNLGKLYNRMMNRGILEHFPEGEKHLDLNAHMNKIKNLMMFIIDAEDAMKTFVISGRAYIELANAYLKYNNKAYITYESPQERLFSLPGNMTIIQCMQKAVHLTPEDAYVNERVGKYCRQMSVEVKDFKKSIEYLEKAVNISPNRHVAWHHMGHAYKSIWILEMDFVEAFLFNNKSNQSRVNPIAEQTRYKTGMYCGPPPVSGHACKQDCFTKAEKDQTAVCHHMGLQCNRGVQHTVGSKQYSPKASVFERDPYVKHPWKVNREKGRMQPHIKLNLFHILRISNPKDPDPQNPHPMLKKAEECLRKATEATNDSSHIYLVDLARVCVSLGKYREGITYLIKASKVDCTLCDKALVYEQFALIKHFDESSDTENDPNKMENVQRLYMEAVEYAAKSKVVSRVAYYMLDEQLDKEIKSIDERNPKVKLHLRKARIKRLVENFHDAMHEVEKGLELDPDNMECVWLLSRLCYDQNNWQNAWQYIMRALSKEDAGSCLSEEQKEHVIRTVIQVTKTCPTKQEDKSNIWHKVLPFLYQAQLDNLSASLGQMSLAKTCSGESSKQKDEKYSKIEDDNYVSDDDDADVDQIQRNIWNYDILLIGISRHESDIILVNTILEEAGLNVFLCTIDGSCDIPGGQELFSYMQHILEHQMPALIYCDIPANLDSFKNTMRILAAEVVKESPVCCYLVAGGQSVALPKASLPKLDITSHRINQHLLVEDIMKKLFIEGDT